MESTRSFIKSLLIETPELNELLQEHLGDYDDLLPHVFIGDVARFVIQNVDSLCDRDAIARILRRMEMGLVAGTDEIEELVVVSFVENMIGEYDAVNSLKHLMGERLTQECDDALER